MLWHCGAELQVPGCRKLRPIRGFPAQPSPGLPLPRGLRTRCRPHPTAPSGRERARGLLPSSRDRCRLYTRYFCFHVNGHALVTCHTYLQRNLRNVDFILVDPVCALLNIQGSSRLRGWGCGY